MNYFKPRYFLIIIMWCLAACQPPTPPWPQQAQRIVSLKPNLTEFLFAVGAGPQVVGVTRHCLWPEAARALPKVGDYAFPDLEKILALNADLVVTNKESGNARFIDVLHKAGIPVLILETRTLAQIQESVRTLGHILHKEQAATELTQRFTAGIDNVRDTQQAPRPALIVVQRQPLIVVAGDFMAELLEAAGGKNVVRPGHSAYPQISTEDLLRWQPQVIFDLDPSSSLAGWQPLQALPAVAQGRVYFLDPNLFLPGPRLLEAGRIMAGYLK